MMDYAIISYVDDQTAHISTSVWWENVYLPWEAVVDEPYLTVAGRFALFGHWKLHHISSGTVFMIKGVLENSPFSRFLDYN